MSETVFEIVRYKCAKCSKGHDFIRKIGSKELPCLCDSCCLAEYNQRWGRLGDE